MPQSFDAPAFSIVPSGGGVGAFIRNVDLSNPTEDQVEAMRAALGHHGVLFFRDQQLDPEAQIALARCFGTININRFFKASDSHSEVAVVLKDKQHKDNIGGSWHTDQSYDAAPSLGSILVAVETPEQGGDTLFANCFAAYDSLSDGLKRLVDGLSAVHSSRHVFGRSGYNTTQTDKGDRIGNVDVAVQDSVHPVVIRHPISGRKSLYVNPGFTLHFDGWTAAESKPLLDYLYSQVTRPEHTYRFQWAPGSVAFWDNRATWHYALNDYPGQRRLMHRVTLEGEPLAA